MNLQTLGSGVCVVHIGQRVSSNNSKCFSVHSQLAAAESSWRDSLSLETYALMYLLTKSQVTTSTKSSYHEGSKNQVIMLARNLVPEHSLLDAKTCLNPELCTASSTVGWVERRHTKQWLVQPLQSSTICTASSIITMIQSVGSTALSYNQSNND